MVFANEYYLHKYVLSLDPHKLMLELFVPIHFPKRFTLPGGPMSPSIRTAEVSYR